MARGLHIQASYAKTPISQFNGNPCLESLWQELDLVAVAKALRREPPTMPHNLRRKAVTTRQQWLAAALSELYVPTRQTLKIVERVWDATILSYQFRNPLEPRTWAPNT